MGEELKEYEAKLAQADKALQTEQVRARCVYDGPAHVDI